MKQHWARFLPATCFLFAFSTYPGGVIWQLFALAGAWLAAGLVISDLIEDHSTEDGNGQTKNMRSVRDLIAWPKKLI